MITSSRNPSVLAARRLARPQGRAAAGRFLLEGAKGIQAALDAGVPVLTLLATPAAQARHPELVAAAGAGAAELVTVAPPVLAAIAQTVTPQGLVAIVPSVVGDLAALPPAPELVCVLVAVGDPGNVGTVLRAADAFGADAVVTTSGSVDPESPKAARASAGSLFHLPVIAGAPWPAVRDALRRRGLLLAGADPHARATTDQAPLERPAAIVLGNEAHGLGTEVRADLDQLVRLPLSGRAESLNLAAAAAVLLYEAQRRRRARFQAGPARPFPVREAARG